MISVADKYAWLEFAGATHEAGGTATAAVVTDPAQVTRTKLGPTNGGTVQVATCVGPALLGPAGLTQVTQSAPSQKGGSATLQNATGVSTPPVPQVVTMKGGTVGSVGVHAATFVGGETPRLAQMVTVKSGLPP